MIKDSGDRTEFSTGAVRDMAEGKGRFDLMPLDVLADILQDIFIGNISLFMDKNDTEYLHKAIVIFTSGGYNNRYKAMLEVAKHFEDGAKKYGEGNWKKGIPVNSYIDSAVRHYIKWLDGWDDEPHDRAVLWNLMCCIWTIEHKEELVDHEV
jgi:hypothetical protein